MPRPRQPQPLAAPLALGALVLGTLVLGGIATFVKRHAPPPDRSPTVQCRDVTFAAEGIFSTAQPPTVYDVEGDGDDELITLQRLRTPGPRTFTERLFLTALSASNHRALWQSPLDDVAAPGRTATAREQLVRVGDRALHIDVRGHLQSVDLRSGEVVARAALAGGVERVCVGPKGSRRVWLDAETAGRDGMIDDVGAALPEPRPAWCPDRRARSFACARQGAAVCDRVTPSNPGPALPDFEGSVVLSTDRFAAAIGQNPHDHRPVLVGLAPGTTQVVWTRTIAYAPGTPSFTWTGPDRGDLAGGRVYAHHPVHGGWSLAALDAATGALAWDVNLPCAKGHPFSQDPTGLSVTLTQVIVQTDAATLALDINTGATRWIIARSTP